jgi:hypothetical protein
LPFVTGDEQDRNRTGSTPIETPYYPTAGGVYLFGPAPASVP